MADKINARCSARIYRGRCNSTTKHGSNNFKSERFQPKQKHGQFSSQYDNQPSTITLKKWPEYTDEFVLHTRSRIDDLIRLNRTSQHENRSNGCVFCQRQHNMAKCDIIPQMDAENRKNPSRRCVVCDNPHNIADCRSIEIVDLALSLTPTHQKY